MKPLEGNISWIRWIFSSLLQQHLSNCWQKWTVLMKMAMKIPPFPQSNAWSQWIKEGIYLYFSIYMWIWIIRDFKMLWSPLSLLGWGRFKIKMDKHAIFPHWLLEDQTRDASIHEDRWKGQNPDALCQAKHGGLWIKRNWLTEQCLYPA